MRYVNEIVISLDRASALEFRLAPDGTFKIEYDYNKPDDYEETDEQVDVSPPTAR